MVLVFFKRQFLLIDNKVSSVRHERGKRLWFNVSEVPVEDTIVGAELRIYKNYNSSSTKPDNNYVVTIYQLIKTDEG